ncbi:hypothetical protein RBSH_00692 [Rhodopirellula baltica SH28]|uniref:Uncharacterized protein n=1 Tax=Rhodopirellula baltica SH28 TaxID=993517 RepID=K5EDJ0_RHOBT|nr:hypothetical protein RBSH_00692 [Rhodopirellula baltica SH28]
MKYAASTHAQHPTMIARSTNSRSTPPSARAIDKVLTNMAYLATNSQTIWQKKQVRPKDVDGIHA